MTAPEVLVVGAGSVGGRHAAALAAAGASVFVTDPDEARTAALTAASPVLASDAWKRRWDGVVVASPSSLHAPHLALALEASDHVLVEKPLALVPSEVAELAATEASRVAVAYNLRFHAPVQRAVELVRGGAAGRPRHLRLWFGSWLPGWRPQVDYRTTYSARSELGGGVLLDAIHELDILVWLLGAGDVDVVSAVVARTGPLEIDVEDTVVALLRGPRGEVATVSLDYLSRAYRRGLEVVGDDATVRLDWARQVIEVEDGDGVRSQSATEAVAASYEAQARAFVAWVGGGPPLPVDATEGLRSLDLAHRVRAASA